MKFRTDFVTNSSSTSYYDCLINYKDSSKQEIYGPEESSRLKDIFDALYNPYSDYEIDNNYELFTRLLFMDIYAGLDFSGNDIDNSLFPVMVSAFLFLAGKKSFPEMVNEIAVFISKEYPELGDNSDIHELFAIDPNSYDDAGLLDLSCEKLNGIFETEGELNADSVSWLLDLLKDNIVSLTFSETESNYGEFVNPEREFLEKRFGEDEPRSTTEDDPLYDKELNKWDFFVKNSLMNDYYSLSYHPDSVEDLELYIDRGIQSGGFYYMIKSAVVKRTEDWYFRDEEDSILEEDAETPDRHIDERDLFYLLACELDQYEPNSYENKFYSENPKHDSLKLLIQNNDIPKNFKHYPITDLLEKAIKHDANEYLDLLLGTGLELDYADIAHFIYIDSLETLYPLFDRGLKIEASAYDDLITYASEHGKPEYTAWLLEQKNKATAE